MKTRKNFWATGVLTMIWSAYFVFVEMMRYTNYNGLIFFIGGIVTFLATYQVLRILQYIPDVLEKQEAKGRSTRRVDSLIQKLDDDELAALRERLADVEADEFESFGTLLDNDRSKRKNRG